METQEQTQAIQIFRKNSENLPGIADVASLAHIRSDARFPHYRSVPPRVRQEWLSLEILKYMRLCNMKPADVMVHAVALDEMISGDRYMADLTQPEIDGAFRNGIFGKYGEYFGITAVSLYGFLEAFMGSEVKRDSARILQQENLRKRKEEERRRDAEERARLRAEIERAKADGSFTPTRGFSGLRLETVDDVMREASEHREKVLRQAREIYAQERNN